MSTAAIDVVRAVDHTPELRSDGSEISDLGTLVIRFSPFNTWYTVRSLWEGTFLERTIPGAFSRTIMEDRAAMRVLFDHGQDPTIGNKVLGPIMELREDADSPVGEIPLFDTSYNWDLLPGLKAGVYGSSMRMRVLDDVWDDKPKRSDYNPDGLPERTITRVGVPEFGPVTFPASPSATAGMRSLTDHFYGQLKQRDADAYDVAYRAAGLPNLTGRPRARSTGGGDSGTKPQGTGVVPVPSPSLSLVQRHDDEALRLRGLLK